MRLPEQVFNDLDAIDAQRQNLDQKEKQLLSELVEIDAVVQERLKAYKAANKI